MDSGPSRDGRGLLRLKYFSKAIIRHPRKDRKVHTVRLLPVVYVLNYHKEAMFWFWFS